MLGNYKLASVRGKLQGLEHCADSCLTQTGNVNLRFLLGSLHKAFFARLSLSLLFFPCSFTCPVSLHLFSCLLCSGMCISAVSDESAVNRALLWARICVFMFHVRTCSLPKRDRRQELAGGKKMGCTHPDRIEHIHWELPTQN